MKRIPDIFVDYRHFLVTAVIAISLLAALGTMGLEQDPSFKAMWATDSEEYREYFRLSEMFGHEEFIIIAIRNERRANDPPVLHALQSMTRELEGAPWAAEVRSIANLRFFRKQGELFGAFPVVRIEHHTPHLLGAKDLGRIRKALPLMDLLLARDLKTVGVLVRIDNQLNLSPETTREILRSIRAVVKRHVPDGSDYRVVGQAPIRLAIHEYSIRTALVFGLLSGIICVVVTVYVFRSLRITVMAGLVLGFCILWELGLMSALSIPLNPTTSISFGLILITALEMVIHMVARYHQFHALADDRTEAVRNTVRFLARPFLFCSATTAVGFGTCMVSAIPMVYQLGLIMALGIMISYCLAMVLVPASLIAFPLVDEGMQRGTPGDLLSPAIEYMKRSIAKHHRLYCLIAFGIVVIMFAGTPFIRTDPQLLRHLRASSPEVADIAFVEKNLTSVHSLALVLTSQPGAFRGPEAWQKVRQIEERLRGIPEVVSTSSLLSFLEYLQRTMDPQGSEGRDLLNKPGVISELVAFASMSDAGRRLVRWHLTEDLGSLRISVRIKNSPSTPIVETIDQVQSVAQSVMKDDARSTVTGELAVYAAHGTDLVRSEIGSIALAVGIITLLMMIQMGTPAFGLVSIVPNIPPLATAFGIMGWVGISLNTVTIFAATVAIGLAVDNTIQYVAQLKREIELNPGLGEEECILRAYGLAAKPMGAWSIVTLLGFLALTLTPFQAAVNFGILVSCAVFMGMFGDLIFMQSLLLTFPWARKLLRKVIEKEASARKPSQREMLM